MKIGPPYLHSGPMVRTGSLQEQSGMFAQGSSSYRTNSGDFAERVIVTAPRQSQSSGCDCLLERLSLRLVLPSMKVISDDPDDTSNLSA
jgi:hypothetical protein